MALAIQVFASGSSANASLIRIGNDVVLLDAGGISWRRLSKHIRHAGIVPGDISAILISHLHADHLGPAGKTLSRKHRVPLYTHRENLSLLEPDGMNVVPFDNKAFTVGSASHILPFEVPHDAAAVTCGFSLFSNGFKLTVATDLGCFEPGMERPFRNSDIIMLKSNHDKQLLQGCCKLTHETKTRIGSAVGHLSNVQAADALVRILDASDRLPKLILLAHLSADRNSPELALGTTTTALANAGYADVRVGIAPRSECSPTFRVDESGSLTLLE